MMRLGGIKNRSSSGTPGNHGFWDKNVPDWKRARGGGNGPRRSPKLSRTPSKATVRDGANAWQFDVGRFVDPGGWHVVEPPAALSGETVEQYRAAAVG